MKIGVLVLEGPYQHQAADSAYHFVKAALAGDYDSAREMHYSLLPLFKAIFIETNPIPVKAALGMMGMLTEGYRLPMCPLAEQNREALKKVLQELKIAS